MLNTELPRFLVCVKVTSYYVTLFPFKFHVKNVRISSTMVAVVHVYEKIMDITVNIIQIPTDVILAVSIIQVCLSLECRC